MYRVVLAPTNDKKVSVTVEKSGGVPVKHYKLDQEEAMDTAAFLVDLFASFMGVENVNAK